MDGSATVLHVDDDPDFVDMAATFLERTDSGLDVITATDVETGLATLEEREVDCIVADYDMPELDGLEFLEAVREDYPDLPFILFTGMGSEEVASDAISAGVTDYLQKGGGTGQYKLLANRIDNAIGQYTAEQHATEVDRRLRELTEATDDVLWMFTADWDELLFVNSAYEEIWGRPIEKVEADSRDFLRGIHPDDRDRVQEAMETLSSGESVEIEYRVNEDEDYQRWVWVEAVPLENDAGEVDRIAGFVRDIADRKAREREVREQKQKIEALHRVATSMSSRESKQAVYDMLVEAARDILEYDIVIVDELQENVLVPQAASSQLDTEQYYEETPIFAEDNFAAKAIRTGEPSIVDDIRDHEVNPADTEFRSALTVPIDGIGVFQTVSLTPGAYDEEDLELVELLIAHGREILNRLEEEEKRQARTEELERKNERLDEFASLVSHDLRNPLNLARGHLDLVAEECESEHLATIDQAHDRMEQLISDLLELTRYGDRVTDADFVSLGGVTQACWATIQTDSAELELEVDENWKVRADQSRLQQLLENLVRNAIDHGEGSVTVRVGGLEEGFYVEDDGPGIPEEDRDAVFEYGYSTAEDGSGLGLAIVDQIVEAHEWSIEIGASSEGGARFEIRGVEVN